MVHIDLVKKENNKYKWVIDDVVLGKGSYGTVFRA